MNKEINVSKGFLVILFIIACLIVFVDFYYVIKPTFCEMSFARQMERVAHKNEQAVFGLDKIVLYSSANAIDYSEGETLQDLDVCQFTDIAIYIDNKISSSDLTGENTIKELYIDNFKLDSSSDIGERTIGYKNPFYYGKFKLSNGEEPVIDGDENAENQETENANEIDGKKATVSINAEDEGGKVVYDVVHTNEANDKANYIRPTFYTECSNPITLTYLNRKILTNYSVTERDTKINFDGRILKATGVSLDDIQCKMSFDIHVKNNLDEKFVCSVGLDVPLKGGQKTIYDGYIYRMQKDLQDVYKFFKL